MIVVVVAVVVTAVVVVGVVVVVIASAITVGTDVVLIVVGDVLLVGDLLLMVLGLVIFLEVREETLKGNPLTSFLEKRTFSFLNVFFSLFFSPDTRSLLSVMIIPFRIPFSSQKI